MSPDSLTILHVDTSILMASVDESPRGYPLGDCFASKIQNVG
jgi:hypothetical protein